MKAMESAFNILVNIKKENEIMNVGRFNIGSDRMMAESIFRRMRGSDIVDESTVLNMELVEFRNGLPQNLYMISCSLQEMTENCRTIAKEVFKYFNLEEA